MPHNPIKAQAENKIKIADHLLSTTFAIVKDPKLLVSVIDALYQAMDLSINAILEFEKNFKKLEYVENEKLEIFRRKIITKYALDPKNSRFLCRLKSNT